MAVDAGIVVQPCLANIAIADIPVSISHDGDRFFTASRNDYRVIRLGIGKGIFNGPQTVGNDFCHFRAVEPVEYLVSRFIINLLANLGRGNHRFVRCFFQDVSQFPPVVCRLTVVG